MILPCIPQHPEVSQPGKDLHFQVEEPELIKVTLTIADKENKENAPLSLPLILNISSSWKVIAVVIPGLVASV